MCFSATGSFAVSGVLTGLGVGALARSTSRRTAMFAAIPLIFAAQQVAEGTVWLTMGGDAHATLNRIAVRAFLGLALVIWPIWLPASLRLLERNPARRRALTALLWSGGVVGAYAASFIARWPPVARIAGHSLRYEYLGTSRGSNELVHLAIYVVPTVIPLFVSTAKTARAIGFTLIGSLLGAVLVQRNALTSVWCFFAAILSGLIIVAVEREERAVAKELAAPSVRA
jgi:hypothetical protein